MILNVRPIISALLRSLAGPTLVAAQIAITLTVLANALYVVKQRIDRIGRPTGMDVPNIFVVHSQGVTERYVHEASIRADLIALRAHPGVLAVTTMDYPPLGGEGDTVGVMLQPDDQKHAVGTHYYEVGEDAIKALGLNLVSGRAFSRNEILPPRLGESGGVGQVIITQALADDLYPDGYAVGKIIYDSAKFLASPATIVGIVDPMYGHRVGWTRVDRVVLAPLLPYPDAQPIVNY